MLVQKYKVFIWEHSKQLMEIKGIQDHSPNLSICSIECWKLVTKDLSFTEDEVEILFSKYNVEKYSLIAVPTNKPKNWSYYSKYKNSGGLNQYFVQKLYSNYLAEKKGFSSYQELESSKPKAKKKTYNSYGSSYHKAYSNIHTTPYVPYAASTPIVEEPEIVSKDKVWLVDSLSCPTFPARSQKIKGLRQATSYLKGVTSSSSIDKGFAVSFNEDFSVSHKHYSGGTKAGRFTTNEMITAMFGKFVRPCPQNPNHGGGCDSRSIKNSEEALSLIEEINKTGEIPEMIIMDKVACSYSGVICPDGIGFGPNNDGTTAAKGAVDIRLNVPVENMTELSKRFWNNDKGWPFAEVLYDNSESLQPILVQLRDGPPMETETKTVEIAEVYIVDGTMSLVAWEKESKKLREKVVELNKENKGIEKTIAIWQAGGSLASHFAVHCREYKPTMPYLTESKSPEVGKVIEMGVKGKENLLALRMGILEGMETAIELDSNGGRLKVKADLRNFLASMHIAGIADLGDETTAKFIGYSWSIGCRIIAALPLGEARHNEILRGILNKLLSGETQIKKEAKVIEKDYTWDKEKAASYVGLDKACIDLLLTGNTITQKKVDTIKLYKIATGEKSLYNAKLHIENLMNEIEMEPIVSDFEHKEGIISKTRDIVYKNAWKLDIGLLMLGLVKSHEGFLGLNGEKWSSSFGGKKWANCTLGLLNVIGEIKGFVENPNSESKVRILNEMNMMINLAHNGGGFSWLDKLISEIDFDNASVLPHFLLSPKRALEAKAIMRGKFTANLKSINLVKKLDVMKDLAEKMELAKKESEKLAMQDKIIADLKAIEKKKSMKMTNELAKELEKAKLEGKKGYEEIKNNPNDNIVSSKFLEGQYYIGENQLHIQVKLEDGLGMKLFGKDYGVSYNLESEEEEIIKVANRHYEKWEKRGFKESLATKETFKYAPVRIWESNKDGCLIIEFQGLKHKGSFKVVYDLGFWEIVMKIKKAKLPF